MEIKSSLLNDEDFKYVKESLEQVSKIDGKQNFRVKTLEYINDSSGNNDDMFFYDMLEFVRFLMPDSDSVAYTTPECLIYLNCPGTIGESVRFWDFIYDHECLHQLWDTFAVGDKIKKELGEDKYDHALLNIASDCVINDYLSYYRKKQHPDNLITPEYLKEQYDVTYDRKVDTQYTLYLKLLKKIDEIKKDPQYQDAAKDGQNGQQGQDGQQNKDGNGGNGGGGQGQDGQQNKDGNGGGGQGQDGQQNKDGNGGNGSGGQGQDGQQNKDGNGGQGKDGQQNKDGNGGGGQGKDNTSGESSGAGKGTTDGQISGMSPDVLKKIAEKAKAVVNKYKSKISGDLGKFLEKCKKSHELSKSGLATNTHKGGTGWNQQMNASVKAFVKKKVWSHKRQYKSTYSRIKRGSGFVKYGDQIKPGRKKIEKKLTINVAFYVDRSASMGNNIKNVFKALYTIAESLKKQYKSESVVDDIAFKIYAFDYSMKELKYGDMISADGGTMEFEKIVKFISEHTADYMINVIITDAQFNVNESETDKFIHNINGMMEFITNTDNEVMKELSKKYNTQLNYILAPQDFSLS